MNTLTDKDLFFINRAIDLAVIPVGAVSPNPYVGGVIVKDNEIIGEGFHGKAGAAHAEVVAIQNANSNNKNTNGATIYVSLEPCCHHGKTGPCTEAIVQAGISKVIYATKDPNPAVAGQGDAYLRDQGIEVICVDMEKAREINRHFFYNQQAQKTYVTLKAAMSLDGKIASKTGDSQWITGREARLKAHELRALHDAIIIGKKTLLNDDPSLTVRIPHQNYPNPIRVLLLRNFTGITHTDFALFNTNDADTWILYPAEQSPNTELKEELLAKSVRLIELNSKEIVIDEVLTKLYEEKVMSVLLEGGSSIYNAFLSNQSVNECALFYGPRLIGDKGAPSLWDESGITALKNAPVLAITATETLGNSIYLSATFKEVD